MPVNIQQAIVYQIKCYEKYVIKKKDWKVQRRNTYKLLQDLTTVFLTLNFFPDLAKKVTIIFFEKRPNKFVKRYNSININKQYCLK